jgi:hypothetical protein
MPERLAFVIAVEPYQDQAIGPVAHAEADGAAFAAALERLGFAREQQTVLLGPAATRTAVASRLRKLAKAAPTAEAVFIYYVGHAFEAEGHGYLTCADSQLDDLAETSIELQAVLDTLKAGKKARLALFLDPRSGLLCEPLGAKELKKFFKTSGRAAFVACLPGETSHASGQLKAGAWAHHLCTALAGKAPLALEDGHLLTATSLQNYLQQEVPRTLRATFKDARAQTPCHYGTEERFVVADVGPILASGEQGTADPRLQPLKRGALRNETAARVKSLRGYRKFHRLPDRVNASALKFIADLAGEDIKADVDEKYAAVREQFGYKRRDVDASCDRGSGLVRTPDFEYSVSIAQAADDPTGVVWRREVSGIRTPEVVLGRPFANVFGDLFDTLVFEFVKPFDLETWVDRVEEEVPEGVKVRCASDCSSCDVTVMGFAGVIRLRSERVEIQGGKAPSSKALVEAFLQFQDLFAGKHDLQALPLNGGGA